MRRLILFLAAAAVLTSCKRSTQAPSAVVTETSAPLASVVKVNDPAASAQLVRGFHVVEEGNWRWTMKQFEVALKPPPGAAEQGARLNFKFSVAEAIVSKVGPITLNAKINGVALSPETYSKSGDYVYSRDVPASALKADVVVVQFTTDKGFEPTDKDHRELSLIAVSIGLEPK